MKPTATRISAIQVFDCFTSKMVSGDVFLSAQGQGSRSGDIKHPAPLLSPQSDVIFQQEPTAPASTNVHSGGGLNTSRLKKILTSATNQMFFF